MTALGRCAESDPPEWLWPVATWTVAGALTVGLFWVVFWSIAIRPRRGPSWMLVLAAELVVIGGSLQLASAVSTSTGSLPAESFGVYAVLLPALVAVGVSLRATQRQADRTGTPTAMRDLPGPLKWAAPAFTAIYVSAAIAAFTAQVTRISLC